MVRYIIVAVAGLIGIGTGIVSTQKKDAANGPELAKLLHDELGIEAVINNEGKIYAASIDEHDDIKKCAARLTRIPTLRAIDIQGQHVDGEVLKTLGRLRELTHLNVSYCQIQDLDLIEIKQFTQLVELDLMGNPITDKGLENLEPLKKLEILRLDQTKLTGTGFTHLQALPRLRNLHLGITPITNDSMKALAQVHSLQVLDMHGTSVSNEGIMHLTGLSRLHNLVTEAKVSETFRKEHAIARAEADKKNLLPKNYPELTVIGR